MMQASKAVAHRVQIDAVYRDLNCKAFDVVVNPLLLKKLLLCGVDIPLVALLGTLHVSVNGQTSVHYMGVGRILS